MNRRYWISLVLFASVIAATAQEQLSGLIHFQGQGKRQAELLGRTKKGWVSLRKTNETSVIEFPASQIKHIQFNLKVSDDNLAEWKRSRQFKRIAEQLEPAIVPCLPYADIPNNFMDHLSTLLQSLYYSDQHTKIEPIAQQAMRYVPPGESLEEARIFRAASLLKQDRIADAQRLFEEAQPVERGDRLSSPYWFVQAQLLMLQQKFGEAHDTFSKIITHNANDREWLPEALYWTVAMYVDQDEHGIAKQIVSELDTSFPQRDWSKRALKLMDITDCEDTANQGYDGRYRWYPKLQQPGATKRSNFSVGFDGRIQYVDLGPVLPFIGARGNAFTISLWYRPEQHGTLVSKGNPDSEDMNERGLSIRSDSVRIRGFEPASMRTIGLTFKGSAWRHVALVRSCDPPELRVYQDGKLGTRVNYSAAYNFSNPEATLLLAAKRSTAQKSTVLFDLFGGDLDDLQIFDAALDDTQVQQLFANPGQRAKFSSRTQEIDFHNDHREYPSSHPIRGLTGPLAVDTLNTIYSEHALSAFNLEFGATALSVLDAGQPGHRLKVDGDEQLGERLFWVNRSGASLPFSRAGVKRVEAGDTRGFLTLTAYAETIPDANTIADLQELGRQTVALTPANKGIVDLELNPSEPAMSFCLYRSNASGEPIVSEDLPPANIGSIFFAYARKPIAHFPFDEQTQQEPHE